MYYPEIECEVVAASPDFVTVAINGDATKILLIPWRFVPNNLHQGQWLLCNEVETSGGQISAIHSAELMPDLQPD